MSLYDDIHNGRMQGQSAADAPGFDREQTLADEVDPREDIVSRLLAACNGHPFAKIAWPHQVLHDAVADIETLRTQLAAERKRADAAYNHAEVFQHRLDAAQEGVIILDAKCQLYEARAEQAESALACVLKENDRMREAVAFNLNVVKVNLVNIAAYVVEGGDGYLQKWLPNTLSYLESARAALSSPPSGQAGHDSLHAGEG